MSYTYHVEWATEQLNKKAINNLKQNLPLD